MGDVVLNRYYEQELHNLRTLATEFGQRNPALAPLLGSGSAVDADVERLLEGVAFLTGLVRQRLDDDFPEFIQSLAQLLFPQFLRPLPCMTVMQYSPRTPSGETIDIPAGTTFSSVDVDDQRTIFSAVFPVRVEPVVLNAASWDSGQGISEARALTLDFELSGTDAQAWQGQSLRLWLGGSFNVTSRLYRLLMCNVKAIHVGVPGQAMVRLSPDCLKPVGFESGFPLLPWPAGAHPAWRILHEYFALPEKLLFVELTGLQRWTQRSGTHFQVRFEFDRLPGWAPDVDHSNFVLHATPAVNVYQHDGQPLDIANRQPEYRVRPATHRRRVSQIFSVDQVMSRLADGTEVPYQPFSAFAPDAPAYHVRLRPSPLGGGCEHYLSLPDQSDMSSGTKTLSIRLSCTDGDRPDSLRLGDICEPTDSSPVRVKFSNIMGVTPYREPYMEDDLLWRVLSHLNANHMALASADSLRKLLMLYLPEQQGESRHHAAGLRQIESIQNVEVTPQRRMVRGMPVEGSAVRIECAGDHFAGPGSLYLFGSVLNEYLSGCATINTFIVLTLFDTISGDTLEWPARIGQHRLL